MWKSDVLISENEKKRKSKNGIEKRTPSVSAGGTVNDCA
jgi:hypothetical protein